MEAALNEPSRFFQKSLLTVLPTCNPSLLWYFLYEPGTFSEQTNQSRLQAFSRLSCYVAVALTDIAHPVDFMLVHCWGAFKSWKPNFLRITSCSEFLSHEVSLYRRRLLKHRDAGYTNPDSKRRCRVSSLAPLLWLGWFNKIWVDIFTIAWVTMLSFVHRPEPWA